MRNIKARVCSNQLETGERDGEILRVMSEASDKEVEVPVSDVCDVEKESV